LRWCASDSSKTKKLSYIYVDRDIDSGGLQVFRSDKLFVGVPDFQFTRKNSKNMPRFHVKKTSLMGDDISIVFKGKVVEGPINKGMEIAIPITDAASVKMKVFDIVHFEKQKDEEKKVGLIVDFTEEPEALDIVLGLNIADETLECL